MPRHNYGITFWTQSLWKPAFRSEITHEEIVSTHPHTSACQGGSTAAVLFKASSASMQISWGSNHGITPSTGRPVSAPNRRRRLETAWGVWNGRPRPNNDHHLEECPLSWSQATAGRRQTATRPLWHWADRGWKPAPSGLSCQLAALDQSLQSPQKKEINN